MMENIGKFIKTIGTKTPTGIILAIIGVYLMVQGKSIFWVIGFFIAVIASFLLNFWLFLIILIILISIMVRFHFHFT